MRANQLKNFPTKNLLTMLLFTLNVVLVVAYGSPQYCHCEHENFSEIYVIRETKSGSVRGVRHGAREGREFHSFTGIPYAKPPIGSLRFAIGWKSMKNYFLFIKGATKLGFKMSAAKMRLQKVYVSKVETGGVYFKRSTLKKILSIYGFPVVAKRYFFFIITSDVNMMTQTFVSPVPHDSWGNEIYNATLEPPTCIQRNYLFSNNPPIEGQEDCLYLNVFVPQVEHTPQDTLLPVMVFIHWGGFLTGRSTTGYLGPEYLMEKEIILVTFNYRLGPFGFLSTLDDEAPGNFGLKDQVLALKWVQDNIESFGGDKNRVTISGQSAGAASTHYHMLSPSSKGLFSQVISESGSALNVWAKPLDALRLQVTFAQALFVGCPNTTDTAVIVSCLRKVPAETIMQTQDYFKTFYGDPLGVYSIVTEKQTEKNPNPFITKTPLEYIEAGEMANVPWIVGTNQNEGNVRAPSRIRSKEIRDALNANFSFILPDLLGFAMDHKDPVKLYENSVQKYLGGQEYVNVSNPKSVQGLVNLYSDRLFVYDIYQAIIKAAAKGNKNIFMYSFNYRGHNSYGKLFAITKEDICFNWGTSHCDELIYLFRSPDFFCPLQEQDDVMSRVLVDLWTNFVMYGNPNSNKIKTWNPLKHGQLKNEDIVLLNITGNYETGPRYEISTGFYEDRMKFWDEN